MAHPLEAPFHKLVASFNMLRDARTRPQGKRDLIDVLDENVVIHGVHHRHKYRAPKAVIQFMISSKGKFDLKENDINYNRITRNAKEYGYVTGTGIWNDDDDKDALIHIAFVFIKPGTDKRRVWQAIRLWGSNADGRQ
jgi:hypothetical protein